MTLRVVHLDPRSLRVLAHPLRVRIVGSLRMDGPATATSMGQRLGESSGLTSYHLRVLADEGFIVEASDHPRSGRQRWWQAAHDMTSWRTTDAGDEPESLAAEEWLTGFHARQGMTWLDEWIHRRPNADPAWREASEINDYRLDVSPTELRQLLAEVDEVVRRHLERSRDRAADDARPVRLLLSAFPA